MIPPFTGGGSITGASSSMNPPCPVADGIGAATPDSNISSGPIGDEPNPLSLIFSGASAADHNSLYIEYTPPLGISSVKNVSCPFSQFR